MPSQTGTDKSILVDVGAHTRAGRAWVLKGRNAQRALRRGQRSDPAVARITGIGKDSPYSSERMVDIETCNITFSTGEKPRTACDVVIVGCFQMRFTKPVSKRSPARGRNSETVLRALLGEGVGKSRQSRARRYRVG